MAQSMTQISLDPGKCPLYSMTRSGHGGSVPSDPAPVPDQQPAQGSAATPQPAAPAPMPAPTQSTPATTTTPPTTPETQNPVLAARTPGENSSARTGGSWQDDWDSHTWEEAHSPWSPSQLRAPSDPTTRRGRLPLGRWHDPLRLALLQLLHWHLQQESLRPLELDKHRGHECYRSEHK